MKEHPATNRAARDERGDVLQGRSDTRRGDWHQMTP